MSGSEVLTVRESVKRHKAWVAAAEPDHPFTENAPRTETYCRTCGDTRHALPHLDAAERSLAHRALYAAEELIRADHPVVTDPAWRFWYGVADWMNGLASRGMHGLIKTSHGWAEFNQAVAVGYAYRDTRGAS